MFLQVPVSVTKFRRIIKIADGMLDLLHFNGHLLESGNAAG